MWLSGTWERKKEEYLAENRENYCLRTCVETKLNPFQAFGFIKEETNNSLFKTDLPLWLISCCTDPAWSSLLDTSSQDSQYYFPNTWMDLKVSWLSEPAIYTMTLFHEVDNC